MMKIDYDEVNAELGAVHAGVRASECHGFLCGYFCASNTMTVDSWREHLLDGIDEAANVDDCIAILAQLAEQVHEEVLSEEISFSLLLPDDESAINDRSGALAEWCAGFVSGLGMGGMAEKQRINDECDEFVKDVVSISHMDMMVEESEDVEAALFEIIEYIRVGTIVLHQEWHPMLDNNERPEVLH